MFFFLCVNTVVIVWWHLILIFSHPRKLVPLSSLAFSLSAVFSVPGDMCVSSLGQFLLFIRPLSCCHHVFWIFLLGFAWGFGHSFLTWIVCVFHWLYREYWSELGKQNLSCCLVLGILLRLHLSSREAFMRLGKERVLLRFSSPTRIS